MPDLDAAYRASIAVQTRTEALKASFGGDRSAAGRYAAEQRWKGHVKAEVKTDDASMRLKEEFEGEQGKIPNSPPNPKGLKAIAIWNWVEGLWRRGHRKNYPQNDQIRHIACGLLGLPLPRFNGVRFMKGDSFVHPQDLTERTKNLIESLDAAEPKQPTLWRGLRGSWESDRGGEPNQKERLVNLQVGEAFVTPLMSSSREKNTAITYAALNVEPNDSPSVVLKIEAGAKGLRTSVIPNDSEVITGGKFVVTARAESTIKLRDYSDSQNPRDYDHKVVVLSVKQVDTFGAEDYKNPHFRANNDFAGTR